MDFKTLLDKKNMSLEELSKTSGISLNIISNIYYKLEKLENQNTQTIEKLANALSFTKEEFIDLLSSYDKNGLPKDKSYLECGLPEFLQESIEAMKEAWRKIDNDEEYYHWDIDYCNLQTDINIAEVEQIISSEQAWYLREKYLRIERN